MDISNTTRMLLPYFFQIFLSLMMSFPCFAVPNQPVIVTANAVEKTYTFKELGWDKSVTLNGYKPSYTFYLPITQYLHVKKAFVHLKIAFSPLLTEDSRIDIKFNQTFIRRVTMPAEANQEINLDVELPLTQLSPQWQSLNFSANLSSGKTLCNPDNWIYISPESSLTLTTIDEPFNGTLNQWPSLYISSIGQTPALITLLLPQNPAPEEIFSLFRIALHLGEIVGDSKVKLMMDFIKDLDGAHKDSNLILIGTADHLFKNTSLQLITLSSNPKIANALSHGAGVILLNPSPFNPIYGLLTFTGSDYTALDKAIKAFIAPEFPELASGIDAIVDKVQISEKAKPFSDWYQTSLEELGYADQSVSGLGRHQVSYTIPLPNDRIPVNAVVKTLITVPLLKPQDHSLITLVMNGRKQSSFRLSQEHSAWSVELNSNAMKPGINKLDYLIDLHLENEHCTLAEYDEIWATIHAQTEFKTLFLSDFPQTMLNQLPVPFSNEVTFIVPDQLSIEDMNNLTQLVFKFGQLIQPNPLAVNFLTSSEANEEFIRYQNIILYGTENTNPWIKFASEFLPLQLKGSSRFLNSEQKKVQLGGERSTGLLELIASPWSERHYILLITGDNEKTLAQAISKLTDDKVRAGLNGNIALFNFDQSVEVLRSDDNRYFSLTSRLVTYVTTLAKNIFYYVENHPLILIYLLVIVVPLFIFMRQRKK